MVSPKFQKRFMRMLLCTFILIFLLHSTVLAEEVLKIGGTGTALGSMQLLAKAFEKSHPGMKVRVILPSLGTSGGIKAISKDIIGIALSTRLVKDDEQNLGLSSMEYAKTPFILATPKAVNISSLSSDEIVKIYRGETVAWPNGERIRLILRPATDTDTLLIKKISPEMSNAVDRALSRQGMLIAITDQDCADMIEKTPGGFSFSTLTQVLSEKRQLKIISFNGVTPSIKTLADGSYPLSKSLIMVTKKEPSSLVRKFIDFVRSKEGVEILEETGNLSILGKTNP